MINPSTLTDAQLRDHIITLDGRGKAFKQKCLDELIARATQSVATAPSQEGVKATPCS